MNTREEGQTYLVYNICEVICQNEAYGFAQISRKYPASGKISRQAAKYPASGKISRKRQNIPPAAKYPASGKISHQREICGKSGVKSLLLERNGRDTMTNTITGKIEHVTGCDRDVGTSCSWHGNVTTYYPLKVEIWVTFSCRRHDVCTSRT